MAVLGRASAESRIIAREKRKMTEAKNDGKWKNYLFVYVWTGEGIFESKEKLLKV